MKKLRGMVETLDHLLGNSALGMIGLVLCELVQGIRHDSQAGAVLKKLDRILCIRSMPPRSCLEIGNEFSVPAVAWVHSAQHNWLHPRNLTVLKTITHCFIMTVTSMCSKSISVFESLIPHRRIVPASLIGKHL